MDNDRATAEAHRPQLHFPFVKLCSEDEPKLPGIFADLYDTPWEDAPREVWFCSSDCEQEYCSSGSFDYVWCDGCDRWVCEQYPRNGWHAQFNEHERLGYICLRCYEEEVLENGQPRSDFEGGEICGGMFFSRGNTEPKSAGFEEVEEFADYFVRSPDSAREYNSHAAALIGRGHKVLTAYESLAIGGLEGYITMMVGQIRRHHECGP